MRSWFRRVLRDLRPEPMLADLLPETRKKLADLTPPTFIAGMDKPERDETKRACVHLYQDIDVELAQAKRANPKVTEFKAKGRRK